MCAPRAMPPSSSSVVVKDPLPLVRHLHKMLAELLRLNARDVFPDLQGGFYPHVANQLDAPRGGHGGYLVLRQPGPQIGQVGVDSVLELQHGLNRLAVLRRGEDRVMAAVGGQAELAHRLHFRHLLVRLDGMKLSEELAIVGHRHQKDDGHRCIEGGGVGTAALGRRISPRQRNQDRTAIRVQSLGNAKHGLRQVQRAGDRGPHVLQQLPDLRVAVAEVTDHHETERLRGRASTRLRRPSATPPARKASPPTTRLQKKVEPWVESPFRCHEASPSPGLAGQEKSWTIRAFFASGARRRRTRGGVRGSIG